MNQEDINKRGLIFTGRHLPYNPRLKDRAKELRRDMTPAEKKLWFGFLRKHRFRSQHPIDNYIVDFYSSPLKLVIEIDGEQHYTEEGKTYDSERDIILELYGLKVIRFLNNDVLDTFDDVCNEIRQYF